MALINDLYIFVKDEKVNNNITTMTHPVEEGIDITDHVRAEAQTINLTGKIVGENASSILSKLQQMQKLGTMVNYVGRNYANNYQITKFNTSHPNTVTGGCEYDMELTQVRIAESPYKTGKDTADQNKTPTKSVTKTGMQQKQLNSTSGSVYHTVKSGETAYSIAKSYNSKGVTVASIMKDNPEAPKHSGDWTTLQIGTKLKIASR